MVGSVPVSARVAERVIAAAFLLAYVLLGSALGQQYPFSPLGMFSRGGAATARIVVRADDGLHEVDDYARFHCEVVPDLVTADGAGCTGAGRHPERDRVVDDYVTTHAVSTEEPDAVVIVRVSHRISSRGGPIVPSQCVLARCTARRAGGPAVETH